MAMLCNVHPFSIAVFVSQRVCIPRIGYAYDHLVTWYPGPNVQAKEGSDRAKEAKELAAQMNKTQVDADARFGLQSGCFSLTASKIK